MNLNLPAKLQDQLEALAVETSKSVSDLVEEGVTYVIERVHPYSVKDVATKLKRSVAWVQAESFSHEVGFLNPEAARRQFSFDDLERLREIRDGKHNNESGRQAGRSPKHRPLISFVLEVLAESSNRWMEVVEILTEIEDRKDYGEMKNPRQQIGTVVSKASAILEYNRQVYPMVVRVKEVLDDEPTEDS